jgi:hypothetical protein
MRWMEIDQMSAAVTLPEGYHLEQLARSEIPALVRFIKNWFPDVSVGAASGYVREDFYTARVSLAGEPEKDVLLILLKRGRELAGLFSCERDLDALTLYAGLAVIAPQHRGVHLSQTSILLVEAIGRSMGMGLIYGMATLKIPHIQRAFERLGWQLIGITPGYDREMVAPGVVKRVYEAVYAKILVSDASLLHPQPRNMTARTKAFFHLLFPRAPLAPNGVAN